MSDRQTTPIKQALPDWRKAVDSTGKTLLQRPIGSPNGLIFPGGNAGTWAPMILAGTWASLAAANAPAYVMDADGFVHLRGIVTHPTNWPVGSIWSPPTGYGTTAEEWFATLANSSGTMGVAPLAAIVGTGLILGAAPSVAWAAAPSGWISLSGISYYAGGQ